MLEQRPDEFSYRYAMVGKHVMELVESGALKPGDRIPSLRQMSGKMRVSVTTVSQAYVELESQGVIESRPKSGFFVRPNFRNLLPAPALEADMPIEPPGGEPGRIGPNRDRPPGTPGHSLLRNGLPRPVPAAGKGIEQNHGFYVARRSRPRHGL